MAAETICEIIFEKAAGTVCCGYKKSFRRKIAYQIYDRILGFGRLKMRRIHRDR